MTIRFSYNYSRWPFVEIDDLPTSLAERITPGLKKDLVDWAKRMDRAFDYETGFTDSNIQKQLNREYARLSQRLKDEGVDNYTDAWWN